MTQNENKSIDAAFDEILDRFKSSGRLDHAHDLIRGALRDRLLANGIDESLLRLLEVNFLGSLSGWMEFALDEKLAGRDVVPDFARHLRRGFISHAREHDVQPEMAIAMAIELSSSIMNLACDFQRHMNLDIEED